jgi:hypothetical protein
MDVKLCILVDRYSHIGGICGLHLQGRTIGCLPNYMASHLGSLTAARTSALTVY